MTSRVLAPSGFGSLMPHMVRDILLVASPYDCFILEEDGRFSDRMLAEYVRMELSSPPHFQHVISAREALATLKKREPDMVLCTPHLSGISAEKLAFKIKDKYPHMPVVMLTYDRAEALRYTHTSAGANIDAVYLWTGDPKLLVAIVKGVEDARNAAHDALKCMVRVIIMVEDDPAFYSAFLPELYQEVLAQCHSLVPDQVNERERRFRMRSRPKILLANNFEDGLSLTRKYHKNLLGIFSDMRFPRKGEVRPRSGQALIRAVRKRYPELPIMLNSWEDHHRETAEELRVQFANKRDEDLFDQVGDFMSRNFGFGPFIFRLPNGSRIDTADHLSDMPAVIKRVPAEALLYHANRNDISNWLMARSEFQLASQLQPRKVSEFDGIEGVRAFLLDLFDTFLNQRQRGRVTDFPKNANLMTRDFVRIGDGSMGGKARGSAFLAHLLANTDFSEFPDIELIVPRSFIICADYYDRFINQDHLREKALAAENDEAVVELFLQQDLPEDLLVILERIVQEFSFPLAVRSSSLLEDATFQPLAGLYNTYMLPNNHEETGMRLHQLHTAVRLVMASAFFAEARRHLKAHNFRPEREKMAVMIQRIVGRQHDNHFYPDFAGVAQSYNYYPISYLKPEDGVAVVALGLGRTVVNGDNALRFSPRHPRILPQMSTTPEALRASQRKFYALDLNKVPDCAKIDTGCSTTLLTLDKALQHGTLDAVGATYSHENNKIYDTVHTDGAKLVNFAGVLKYDRFPLAPLLDTILARCRKGMGGPVEIEFAVTLPTDGKKAQMALLELRPLSGTGGERDINLKPRLKSPDLLAHGPALGNGITRDIYDIIFIHPDRFQLSQTRDLALLIEGLNHQLTQENRPYLLIGPGRWGTTDPWMGIPVVWSQVSGAKCIIELELVNSNIEPSLGTHFFHNLSALRVGYFCINTRRHKLHFDWFDDKDVIREVQGIKHIRLKESLEVMIDGRCGEGVVI